MTPPTRHVLTVNLEDYFQVGAFNRFIQKARWTRFESRIEVTTRLALDLLAAHKATATFFVLGWTAEQFPDLIRGVADAGHEVAVRGFYHRRVRDMTPDEFKADAARAKRAVERATGRRAHGYRVADGWFGPDDLWALDALAELGFTYDSSLAPMGKNFGDDPARFAPHRHAHAGGAGSILEVPVSTGRVGGVRIPVAGGNYLRQLPRWLTRRAQARWVGRSAAPLVAYFQSWELDPDQPKITGVDNVALLRHYRNLAAMPARLADLLSRYRFGSVADFLGLAPEPPAPSSAWAERAAVHGESGGLSAFAPTGPRVPVSVVVPCYNEELLVPHLKNALDEVGQALGRRYDLEFVLVDDGSTDRTWAVMQRAFAGRPGYQLLRHSANLGIAAAIMTGLRGAHADTVCSMDSDGSYDPLKLAEMIPLLVPGVDLVTASPYHPAGGVKNVPGWRLWLSKGCAWLYRRMLKTKLHTYTSCFRVYRRSTVAAVPLKYNRYLGIAELVGRLDLAGKAIVEYPAVLESRMIGRSKMKVISTVLGHLRLMARLAVDGWRQRHDPDRDQVIRSQLGYIADAVTPPARPPEAEQKYYYFINNFINSIIKECLVLEEKLEKPI